MSIVIEYRYIEKAIEDVNAQAQYDIEQQETLLFEKGDIPLTQQEWQQLSSLLADSEYEHVIGGDANESHSVWVSRYYNDVGMPKALSDRSADVSEIIMSPKMRDFYKQFAGTDELCLRRCQANRMFKGDYIGEHKDQDSSPDYLATIVFHFSSEYTGGLFVTNEGQRYRPAAYMALVNNCSVPHLVSKVESGERLTLACFLSPSFSANKKRCSAFQIDGRQAPH